MSGNGGRSMTEDTGMWTRCEEWVAHLEAMEHHGLAGQARKLLELAQTDLREWWDAPMAYAEAAEWSGYTESQLRRHVNEGKVQQTPEGKFRRRNLPIKPGHHIDVGVRSAEVLGQHWTEDYRDNRRAS